MSINKLSQYQLQKLNQMCPKESKKCNYRNPQGYNNRFRALAIKQTGYYNIICPSPGINDGAMHLGMHLPCHWSNPICYSADSRQPVVCPDTLPLTLQPRYLGWNVNHCPLWVCLGGLICDRIICQCTRDLPQRMRSPEKPMRGASNQEVFTN